VIVFPNCKINLGLHILRKRSDGYHDLQTVFYPVPLNDALEIIEIGSYERSSTLPFSSSGIPLDGTHGSNLCVKAYRLLKKDFPGLPHIRIHLHKSIPSGAGLGGGSADAAFTLQLLNKHFNLKLSKAQLLKYADELGSDCSFFIINKPCYASGKGELLEEISLDLTGWKIVVVYPSIHVDTGGAFQNIEPSLPEKSLKEIITQPVEKWKYELQNDFEKVIFKRHRKIVEIKDELYRSGAVYASMSGSGSTVFGIFPQDKALALHFPPEYFVRELPGQLQ
jgi:4-diphosphocytidyl-2-C-methyl-D-erythritol kinase